jgi:hypothetical protein
MRAWKNVQDTVSQPRGGDCNTSRCANDCQPSSGNIEVAGVAVFLCCALDGELVGRCFNDNGVLASEAICCKDCTAEAARLYSVVAIGDSKNGGIRYDCWQDQEER